MKRSGWIGALSVAAVAATAPDLALAYIGPGAGLTVIGTVIALIAAVVLAVAGFLWYPLKRLLGRRRGAAPGPAGAAPISRAAPDK